MLPMKKHNKTVLILGGAKRLGGFLTAYLSKEYSTFFQYKESKKEAEKLTLELRQKKREIFPLYGDFSSEEKILAFCKEVKEKIPSLFSILYTIGPYFFDAPLSEDITSSKELFHGSVWAPKMLFQQLSPLLKKEKGSILTIGMCGLETKRADIRTFSYTLAKKSLLFLTQSLALELAKEKIRVNMISPGYLFDTQDPAPKDTIPLGREGRYEDIASAVSFLLKEEYITGQNLEVAGGVRL